MHSSAGWRGRYDPGRTNLPPPCPLLSAIQKYGRTAYCRTIESRADPHTITAVPSPRTNSGKPQVTTASKVQCSGIRQAFAAADGPPPRKKPARPAPITGTIREVLDTLADEPLTVWEIWTTVTDDQDSDASYAAIRDYIGTRRLARQTGT